MFKDHFNGNSRISEEIFLWSIGIFCLIKTLEKLSLKNNSQKIWVSKSYSYKNLSAANCPAKTNAKTLHRLTTKECRMNLNYVFEKKFLLYEVFLTVLKN